MQNKGYEGHAQEAKTPLRSWFFSPVMAALSCLGISFLKGTNSHVSFF